MNKKDRKALEEFFKDHLKINDSEIVIQNTWRLGKPDPSKVRVLKVILDREHMVSTVLKATKNLATISDPNLKKISIFKDLIPEDRDKRKTLVTEMKAKNEILKVQIDPTTNLPTTDKWIIRDGKVILVDKEGRPKRF